MKIGQGWKKFCRDNGFRGGDQVVFEFINEFSNLVNVKKYVFMFIVWVLKQLIVSCFGVLLQCHQF